MLCISTSFRFLLWAHRRCKPTSTSEGLQSAAMFTPSPNRSPARTITSPMWIPMRKLMWRSGRVRLGQGSLRLHRALHGVHSASELRKDTVARRVRYAAPVVPNEPVEDCAPFGQPLERADLIGAHEAAIAFDIRCEDSATRRRLTAGVRCHRVGQSCALIPKPHPSGTPANRRAS